MKTDKYYFMLTLVVSVLVGILLTLALGVKDSSQIAIVFNLV